MSLDDIYAKPISLEGLQQFKALSPLLQKDINDLVKIEKLDITGFSEAEVRAYVIDPIVRILGYDKGTDFSANLEKSIEFLNKKKFPDYNFNLWKENFWLIEAKCPQPSAKKFGYKDLAQAIEYAVHPDINAALVVLCDGHKLEVFDREVSVTKPILHVIRNSLVRDFDKLRQLLEPMQIWFFQKRRIVRLIDKVFNKEFNLHRVEEFSALIQKRLVSKRTVVLENFRRNVKPDYEEQKIQFSSAPIEELVDVHFFFEHSLPLTDVLIDTLVARCEPSSFQVVHKIFPDHPRDSNDTYYAHAVMFLMGLGETRDTIEWVPAWIVNGQQTKADLGKITQYLLQQCLNYFANDEARRVLLLAANSIRRIFKLLLLSNEKQWHMGEVLHFLGRYRANELSWSQIISSPQGHLIGLMDGQVLMLIHQFVTRCKTEHGSIKIEIAKLHLKELWKLEGTLLKEIDNYPQLCKERNLGDMRITEAASVTYDILGHNTLCLISRFPRWKEYVVKKHRAEIMNLASMNSWAAREVLGIDSNEKMPSLTDELLANRFFLGSVETLNVLRSGYKGFV